ncbi:protein kinase [Nocardia sp. NPDC058058]|uniref:serine/threonine-protein kinase n=1 Tax=Nocardia sp. NPDC058058 TaxID=3346317 RepID=UPI0036DAE351
MTEAPQPLTIGDRFGPYRLDGLIGRGGMGEVYRAYDTGRERIVALKVLPAPLAGDPVYRRRFQRESRAAARLREAHVIPIHDFGEIDGRLYIDMRLVEGASLRSLLHREAPLAPETTVALITQIAAALDAAHREELLHRDVKPDNILVTPDGFAYLVDFGIARAIGDDTLTRTDSPVGSFGYMAPERFTAGDVTAAADVYALACVLYECLTGTRPYSGSSAAQVMYAHLAVPIPHPSLVRAAVPEGFDAVVARGMAKSPRDRYRTAGALAAAARTVLTGPVLTQPSLFRVEEDSSADSGPAETITGPTRASGSDLAAHMNHSPTAMTEGDTPAPTPDETPPETEHPAETSTGRTRFTTRRKLLALTGVLVLALAALGVEGWTALRGERTGTPIPDATALQAPDIELLSLTTATGYKRANCVRGASSEYTVAALSCAANPASGDPTAHLWRFRSVDSLRDSYVLYLHRFRAAPCAGDPAGLDAASVFHDQEVGRRACFTDRENDPASPKPALVLTNEKVLTMAVYTWAAAGDETIRDYAARHDLGQVQLAEDAEDPDAFTPAQYALLDRLGRSEYRHTNCRHLAPKSPSTLTNAILTCGLAGGPAVVLYSYPDRRTETMRYQARLTQYPGHGCGGTGGSDDVWRQTGGPVGRFFCFDDTTSLDAPPHPCLLAADDERVLTVLLCTLAADDPRPGPKTERDLGTWFGQHFG